MNMLQFLKDKYYRNKEMVSYWKSQDFVEAKVMEAPEGHYVMQMQGEKYPFSGFPRGSLLYGKLSPLKHQIKNKIFNATWKDLEEGVADTAKIKASLNEIFALVEECRYDMLPPEKLCPAVKELWRGMTAIEHMSSKIKPLKEVLTFILQEDDGYRFRFQWMAKFFSSWYTPKIQHFSYALSMFEHAEVVGDMKERIRLLRRVLLFALTDKVMLDCFNALFKELDWSKIKLTKADKYFFRAKYFRVDYPEYGY